MPSPLVFENSFLWSCVWQTTACLVVGLLGSFLWARRPARAHRILLLAMIACLVTPLLSQTVRHLGWGILVRNAPAIEPGLRSNPPLPPVTPVATPEDSASSTSASVPKQTLPAVETGLDRGIRPLIPWRTVLIWLWVALSGFCVVRLFMSLAEGFRLVIRAQPATDAGIQQAVGRAATELRLKAPPETFLSDDVRCPLLWCWWRRPALLIPGSAAQSFASKERHGVLCHELAHLKRRDHLARLLGELLVCVIPWQPLAWWAKQRLGNLSEQACDDWVLAGGQSPTTYAQLLLGLLPQRRPSLVLATVTSRNSLKGRIRHILRGRRSDPRPGRYWACGAAVVMAFAIAAIAFAQTRAVAAESSEDAADWKTTEESESLSKSVIPSSRMLATGDILLVWGRALSPDGRYLTGVTFEGELILINVETGRQRKLADKCWEAPVAWSPDGTRVAINKNDLKGDFDLVIITVETGESEILLTAPTPWVAGWSPDGKTLLCTEWAQMGKDGKNVLALVSLNNKEITRLKTEDQRPLGWQLHPRFSPDGKTIVYCTEESNKSILHLRAIDDTHHTTFTDFAGRVESPLWSPDGRYVIFRGTQGRNTDLWGLKIEDERFVGLPILVRPDVHSMEFFTWVRDGRLAYSVRFSLGGLNVLPVHPQTGRASGSPRQPRRGGGWSHVWAPDGKQIAQTTDPTKSEQGLIFLSPENGRILRELPLPEMEYVGRGQSWSSDGSTILTGGIRKDGKRGLFGINVETGEVELLVPQEGGPNFDPTWSPDNKTIVFGNGGHIFVVNLDDGTPRQLTAPSTAEDKTFNKCPAISPDGRLVAYIASDKTSSRLLVSTLDGSTTREVLRYEEGMSFNTVSWSPDGRFIVFRLNIHEPDTSELWVVPSVEGDPFQLPLPRQLDTPFLPRWSPDGRSIAFIVISEKLQYWVMENFLPVE